MSEQARQLFLNKDTTTVSKDIVVKGKRDRMFSDRDVAVCKFLFKHKFATLAQINTVLTSLGHEELTFERARTLCQSRIVNKFVFIQDSEKVNFDNPETQTFYCLDLGGKYLLEQYEPSVDVTSWLVGRNAYSKEFVTKIIMANEVYIKIASTMKENLLSFNILKEVRMGKEAIQIDFDFNIRTGDTVKYYIGNFFNENDIYDLLNKKSLVLESLVVTNGWKKYSMNNESTEPAVFFIGENDKTTMLMAEKLHECGFNFNNKDRYSTYARIIKNNLYDANTFLKYESNGIEKRFKLTRISSFVPQSLKQQNS